MTDIVAELTREAREAAKRLEDCLAKLNQIKEVTARAQTGDNVQDKMTGRTLERVKYFTTLKVEVVYRKEY